MAKMIVTEETLNRLIRESIEECIEEGLLGNIANKAGQIRQNIKNNGGLANTIAGGIGRGVQGYRNFKNNIRKAYNAGKAAANVKSLYGPHPLDAYRDKYGDKFVQDMNYLSGYDANGKSNYAREQLLKTLDRYNVSQEDKNAILQRYGFALDSGNQTQPTTQSQGQTNNGGPQANPVVQNNAQNAKNGVQQNVGGGAGMDYSIEEAVSGAIKEYINEIGDTVKGQKKLGKLYGKRTAQCWSASNRGDNDAAGDYSKRMKVIKDKAKQERNAQPDFNKQNKMLDAFYNEAPKAVNKAVKKAKRNIK